MSSTRMRRGFLLRVYLLASFAFPLFAAPLLRKRLARGKEDPERWVEKLAQSLAPRPKGTLIWLHAVGLGEVLSLRGLIARMADLRPELSFVVTSTTVASAQVFGRNLPPRTIHQFLPIDAPSYRRRFLEHFAPNLCLWAEQDLWPGFVSDLAVRGIPQAIIAARMNERSYRSHGKARRLYRDLYGAMELITAQDQTTADHLRQLGASEAATITGSLKPSAPALNVNGTDLGRLTTAIAGRTVWAVAPSHPADEQIAIAAHHELCAADPTALLIIAPRFPDRRDAVTKAAGDPKRHSDGALPAQTDPIWLCDTFGDLGLVYRVANTVLIGGTFSDIEGHNPWEAAILNTAILHGPRVANFKADFAQLNAANAARPVTDADDLAAILGSTEVTKLGENAQKLIKTASAQTDALAGAVLNLLDKTDG